MRLRDKIWKAFIDFVEPNEGKKLPLWTWIFCFALFPLKTIVYAVNKRMGIIDVMRHCYKIDGIEYSFCLFDFIKNSPIGSSFTIVSKENNHIEFYYNTKKEFD